jgi:hypothetical protein
MRTPVIRLVLAALLLAASAAPLSATPARIIILRHGEKDNSWKLCHVGQERAEALAATYLGENATKSLFAKGERPVFLAITLHSLELASPSALSRSTPIVLYSVVPEKGLSKSDETEELNRRTQEAAHDVMTNPAYDGKTVVMVWEHKHIANAKLEAKFPGQAVTLSQLFKLDSLPGVPKTWPSATYDYFWIVDFPADAKRPSKFSMIKQQFGGSYADLPANDWGTPNGLDPESNCDLKGDY